MAVIPMSYSPATVARRFSILDGVTIQGVLYQIIWDPKTPFAAVIEAAPSVIDGDIRHKVVATLELQRRSQLEGVFVRKFWEEQDVAQIEGIVVDGAVRDVSLATWICPYISRHLLSLNPLQARCRRYSRGER